MLINACIAYYILYFYIVVCAVAAVVANINMLLQLEKFNEPKRVTGPSPFVIDIYLLNSFFFLQMFTMNRNPNKTEKSVRHRQRERMGMGRQANE